MPGLEPTPALGRGSCALHGEVEGPRDTKGRARCPVRTCRRILAVRGSRGAPSTKGLTTLPDRQALEDPDFQKLRKRLAVAELRRKTYEVDRSLVWEARAPELDRRLVGVEDRLRQLAARGALSRGPLTISIRNAHRDRSRGARTVAPWR